MPNYIIYFADSTDEVNECAYSLLKYLDVYNLKPPADQTLVVHTVKPALLEAYGAYFRGFRLVEKWEGARSKLDLVKDFAEKNPGNHLYFHNHTYPLKEIDAVFSSINSGTVFAGRRSEVQGKKPVSEFSVLGFNTSTAGSADVLLQRGNVQNIRGLIAEYGDFPEFRSLLRHFFLRHQEESIPNQVKLLHHMDALQIQEKRNRFRQLPLHKRLIQTIRGKAWRISDYRSRI